MKVIKRLGYSLSLVGFIMYLPPMMELLTLHFGETIGRLTGVVSFVAGWAILGAHLAYSAGFNHQRERIKKNLQ
jgi:hypothetical protein